MIQGHQRSNWRRVEQGNSEEHGYLHKMWKMHPSVSVLLSGKDLTTYALATIVLCIERQWWNSSPPSTASCLRTSCGLSFVLQFYIPVHSRRSGSARCDYTLKRGKMPAQAKANYLVLEDVPAELSDLNSMEIRLISLRIPFMKMVALPCGKQRAIHGPAVNVPTDLHPVCDLLPRLPSQVQVVPMKLKRKLCYKGHYMYQYVRPAKLWSG